MSFPERPGSRRGSNVYGEHKGGDGEVGGRELFGGDTVAPCWQHPGQDT